MDTKRPDVTSGLAERATAMLDRARTRQSNTHQNNNRRPGDAARFLEEEASPGRRLLRRQRLTTTLASLRASEAINLGAAQSITENSIQSPQHRWYSSSTTSSSRQAPRRPVFTPNKNNTTPRTPYTTTSNPSDASPAMDLSDITNAFETNTDPEFDLLPPPPPPPISTNTFQSATSSSSPSLPSPISSTSYPTTTTATTNDLSRLRQSWSENLNEKEAVLRRQKYELEAYESKLQTEARRLRKSTEQLKYQTDDMKRANEINEKSKYDVLLQSNNLKNHEMNLEKTGKQGCYSKYFIVD